MNVGRRTIQLFSDWIVGYKAILSVADHVYESNSFESFRCKMKRNAYDLITLYNIHTGKEIDLAESLFHKPQPSSYFLTHCYQPTQWHEHVNHTTVIHVSSECQYPPSSMTFFRWRRLLYNYRLRLSPLEGLQRINWDKTGESYRLGWLSQSPFAP